MGIYVINRDVMRKLLTESFPNVNDLTTQVIPGAISLGMKVINIIFPHCFLVLIYFFNQFYHQNFQSFSSPPKFCRLMDMCLMDIGRI